MVEVRKKWKTFDGSTIVEEEGEEGRRSTWRFSLQGKRSHSFTAPEWSHHHPLLHHHHYPHHPYQQQQLWPNTWLAETSYNLSSELENMSIIDKLNDDDDEILEVVIESDYEPERSEPSERDITSQLPVEPRFHQSESRSDNSLSLPSSLKPTIRGNLSRQDNVTGSNKSSSETSTETDNSRATSTEASLPEKEETEGRRFRTIQKQKRRSKGSKSVSILVPKPKTDKSTQVSYSEIKAETGWKPPTLRLYRRKKYLKVTNTTTATTTTTTSSKTSPGNYSHPAGVVLSRESSLSGNTDLLSASPPKNSRLSSKSSSFSETSLIFGGSDGADFPEHLATKRLDSLIGNPRLEEAIIGNIRSESDCFIGNTRLENSIIGNARLEDSRIGNTRLEVHGAETGVKSKEESVFATRLGKGESRETTTDKTNSLTREDGTGKDIPTSSDQPQHNAEEREEDEEEDKKPNHPPPLNAPKSKDARPPPPPPYSRARSDPQFTRRPYFSEDLHRNNNNTNNPDLTRGNLPLGRPPRPRDLHVLDWIQRTGERDEHEQPERQGTVDTLDSGIENESPNYSGFVSGHRRIHRRTYPWSIDLEPSLIRANAAAMELSEGEDPFSGHRRLSRQSYPREMDLDPRLVQDNAGSRPSGQNTNHDSLHLTLGVIEAAVHHTVCRLLSASSVNSYGSHRNLPNFSFREREESRDDGDKDGRGSYSDSELHAYKAEVAVKNRKKRKRKRKWQMDAILSRSTSTVKEDFVRSVAILPEVAPGNFARQNSPDIAETKSDGRYSPYSITDIPCFELPSQSSKLHQSLLRSPSRSVVHTFPHPTPSSTTTTTTTSRRHPNPSQHPSRHPLKQQQMQQKQQSQDSSADTEKERTDLAAGGSSQASSSGKTSLALRRQIGTRSPTSSPELLEGLGVDLASHSRRVSDSKKLHRHPLLRSFSLEKGMDSDTNTSEESCKVANNTAPALLGQDSKVESRLHTQALENPRIVIHGSGHTSKQSKLSSSSAEESYQGFGISRNQRHDLLDRLRGFRDLTEQQKWESPEGSRKGLSPTPSSENELCLTETSSCYLSQYSDPFDDHSPLSPAASLFTQKSFFQEGDLEAFKGRSSSSPTSQTLDAQDLSLDDLTKQPRDRLESGSSCGRDMALSPLQAKVATACVKDVHAADETGSDASEGPDEKGGRCVAFGAGLSFGLVGEENNFQVWTERPGHGCVTVAVFGPRSHCVTETSVTYIGDNLYDVSYSVTSPGYYVIVVKWGEHTLPDSPFICKVTY